MYIYGGTFDLLVFEVIFGSFGALVSKWPETRKWLTVEQNVKFGLLVIVHHIVGTFNHAVLTVIWGSFGALVSKWPVT